MKKLYILSTPHLQQEQRELFESFVKANKTNLTFLETLDAVANHLSKFTIINNTIEDLEWSKQYNTWIFKMTVRDVMGNFRPSVVIKQMRNFRHTYEIRINQQFYKHRILFQFNNLVEGDIEKEEFFILSYGFSKMGDQTDLTDSLSSSNDCIKADIVTNLNQKSALDKWLGGEWLEY